MPEAQEDFAFQRRLPSVYRKISEIGPDDIRVCIIGRVLDVQGGSVVIDDGTAKITAAFDSNASADIGSIVRVFSRVIHSDGGFDLQGEILQALVDVDVEMYKKIERLWAKD